MKPVRAVRRGVINAEIEKVFGVVNIIIMPNFKCLNILEINEMKKITMQTFLQSLAYKYNKHASCSR